MVLIPDCVLNRSRMQVPSCTKRPVHTGRQCFVWNNNEIKSVDLKAGGHRDSELIFPGGQQLPHGMLEK